MSGFVFSADWHLSQLTWQHRPRLLGDTFFALQQVVAYCIAHGKALIGAGDLFDKDRPDPAAVAAMCRQMDLMQAAGLPVYYIQGQHERATPPWMSVHPWPEHVHMREFTPPGCQFSIAGMDWQSAGVVKAAYATIPRTVRMIVGHQVWHENMGSITMPELSVFDVPPGPTHLLVGDFHQHCVNSYGRADANAVCMLSPGAFTMRNVREPAQHGFFDYDPATDQFKSVWLQSRPVVDGIVRSPAELEVLVARVEAARAAAPAAVQDPIVRVSYQSDAWPAAHAQIFDALRTAHVFEADMAVVLESPAFAAMARPEVVDDNISLNELLVAARGNVPEEAVRQILHLMTSTQPPRAAVADVVTALRASAEREVVSAVP